MPSTFVVSFCQQVPPEILLQKGVHLSRCVQSPHQFVVVFPRSYTATISCGYTLAESAHFATKDWIQLGLKTATVGYLTEIDKHIYQCWNAENSHMIKYKKKEGKVCYVLERTLSVKDIVEEEQREYTVFIMKVQHIWIWNLTSYFVLFLYKSDQYFILIK